MRWSLLLCSLVSFYNAAAVPDPVADALNAPAQIGEARFTYYLWDVYDATLYSPQGQWKNQPPYALNLTYLRDLKGEKIAQRSIDEIKKQGFDDAEKLAIWRQKMTQIFPDVHEDDELLGIAVSAQTTRFYHNGNLIGTVDDSEFTQWFFAIWLSENTSEPEFRQKLLSGVEQ